MSIVTTVPRIGQRVTANTVPGMETYNGKVGVVTQVITDGRSLPILAEFQSISKPDDSISLAFADWSPVVRPAVKEGDKIRALEVHAVPHAVGRIATVIRGSDTDTVAREIWCQFESYQNGRETEPATQWYVHEWEQAFDAEEPITWETRDRMIGKMIKVIYSGCMEVTDGSVHRVTSVFRHPEPGREKVADITVGVTTVEGGPDRWVQGYTVVEEREEPEYVPSVGDHVKVTGYLTDDGIIDFIEMFGVVDKVDNGVWLIDVDGNDYVSGPGYVFSAERPTLTQTHVEDAPSVPVEPAIITDLQRELDRANARVTEYADRAGKWERDFDRIAEGVRDEAVSRGWCDEYERVMNRIEQDLEIGEIPPRDVEVDIEWEETYEVTVRRLATVRMSSGYDTSDIEREAERLNGDSDASREDILEAVRNGNYSAQEFVEDSAAEL